MDTIETMTKIDSGAFDEAFGYLYSEKAQERARAIKMRRCSLKHCSARAVRSACSARRDAPRWAGITRISSTGVFWRRASTSM